MTIFRLRRLFPRIGSSLFACALCFVLLAGVLPAVGATRSRTRRPLPALEPLRYTERSFAAPRGGKAGTRHTGSNRSGSKEKNAFVGSKPAGSQEQGTRSQGNGTRSHGKGSHSREPQPADLTPMHRASRRSAPPRDQLAGKRQPTSKGRRVSLAPSDPVTAEVTGRSARGEILTRLHHQAVPTRDPRRAAKSGEQVIIAEGPYTPFNGRTRFASLAPVQRHPDPSAARSHGPSGAGFSRPEGSSPSQDSRNPSHWPALPYAALPAVAATVQAPGRASRPPSTQLRTQTATQTAPQLPTEPPAQLISGFGSELALAPTPDHPAATRRRNHPLAPSSLAEDHQPGLALPAAPTLAEREANTEAAISPAILPDSYDGTNRLVMPAPLKGSREVLIHQNFMAESEGLERIGNDTELNRLRATHELVDLPAGAGLRINDDLPYNRRSARPWTVLFAQDLSRDYYTRFHQPLWVTSAVRTVDFQSHLLHVNGNAAGLYGQFASPHLTGQAIDFGKHGMSAAEVAWMRTYLLPLMQSGMIDVEEEFQQACFHISVYRNYAGGRHPAPELFQASSQPSAYPPARRPLPTAPRAATALSTPELPDPDR